MLKKNDFIEIEFTGKANGEIFDTTDPEEAKKLGVDGNVKPLIISIGNQMLIKGFDESLEGKEINKEYNIKIEPKKAFGLRNPNLIRIMPLKIFKEKNIMPQRGMTLDMDNRLVKILSVSGGRVSVDFNNPLAGKEIEYTFRIKRKIENDEEKINALQDFFLKQRFEFEIKDKKVIFKKPEIKQIIDIFKDKFKEMTGLEFDVAEISKPGDNLEKKESKS